MSAITFAAVLPALLVAHQVADHWVQTDAQAVTKVSLGWHGRLACLRHVTTYTATLALVLALVGWRLQLGLDPVRVGLVLAGNGLTHYWADRRTQLLALARLLGKGGWLQADPSAGYKLDQSLHIGVLLAAALFIA
jgi:hypothetical protein